MYSTDFVPHWYSIFQHEDIMMGGFPKELNQSQKGILAV